jgi:peptidoglycan/LPS O-acetylase OafA/YrhL
LITGILFDTRFDAHRVRNFYVRRTLRIFPLYYGVMLVIIAAQPLMHWQWNWHWLVWPTYLGNYARFIHVYRDGDALQRLADFQPQGSFAGHTLVLYLGHFWSLCVEEQFYLVWPWVVFWIRDRRKLFWICAATLPLCLTMRIAGQHMLPSWMLENEILYRATPFRLDALFIGGIIALVLRGNHGDALLRAARILLPLALATALLWTLVNPDRYLWRHPYHYPDWKFTWGLSMIDMLSALLVLVALQPGSVVYRVFNVRPLRWLGRISYGAYVFHDILHRWYQSLGTSFVRHFATGRNIGELLLQRQAEALAAGIGLGATIFLAWFSFRFFESFFLNIKERWTVHSSQPIDLATVATPE